MAEAMLGRDRKAAAEFVQRFSGPLAGYVRSRLQPRGINIGIRPVQVEAYAQDPAILSECERGAVDDAPAARHREPQRRIVRTVRVPSGIGKCRGVLIAPNFLESDDISVLRFQHDAQRLTPALPALVHSARPGDIKGQHREDEGSGLHARLPLQAVTARPPTSTRSPLGRTSKKPPRLEA